MTELEEIVFVIVIVLGIFAFSAGLAFMWVYGRKSNKQ